MAGPYDDLIPDQPLRAQIRQRESGGRNLPPEANYAYPNSQASSDYQIQPRTWSEWTHKFNIGTQYPAANKAPAGVRDAIAEKAVKAYGPNSTYTWAASAPRGGYWEKKDPYADLIPKQNPYADLIPKVSPDILAKARSGNTPLGPNRPPGAVDPEIAARGKAATPEPGFFDPEKKVYAMLTADPKGTLKKLGAATLEEAKSMIAQLSPAHLAQLAHRTGQETAANTATPETAGDVANLAQLGMKGAPGGRMGMPGRAVAAVEKPATKIPEVGEGAEPIPHIGAEGAKGAAADLPPVAQGFVRFYHGGVEPVSGGGRWVTTDPNYAAGYRGDKELHFLDLPANAPNVVAAQKWETGLEASYGASQVGTYDHFETTEEQAKNFKPVPPRQTMPASGGDSPRSAGAAATNRATLTAAQAVPPVPTKAFIGSTDDSFFRLRGAATADKAQFDNWVKTLPPEMRDAKLQERLFRYTEGDGALTPEEQALHDQYIAPLRREAQDLYEEIKKISPGTLSPDFDPEYAHRMAKGKSREFDPWMGEASGEASPVSGYRSRSTGSLKERVYYAIENDKGQRKTVAITDTGAMVLNKGQATPLPRYQGAATKPGDKFSINGEGWTVKQAKTSEIEADTNTRYYKNALASTIKNVVQLRAVARSLAEIKRLQSTPEWTAYTRPFDKAPDGWESVDFPPFRGFKFEPKFANVINDFWTYRKAALGQKLAAINRFAVQSLFWSPVPHALNAGAHWVTARGWDWVTLQGLRSLALDTPKAVREVVTQGPEYQRFLREGGGLVYGSIANEEFHRSILKALGEAVQREPAKWDPIARAMGVGPSDLVRMLYGASSRALWAASDMMMMQRYFELTRKGMSPRDAIAEAEKHIPNYRIPPQVLGSRLFAMALKDPSLTVFSRYHYGQWKSYAHMAKDLAVGTPAEKFHAMGNIFATAVLISLVGSLINRGIQKLTGDDKLEMGPKGSTTIPVNLWDAWHGKPIEQVVQQSLTLAPAPKMLYEGLTNRDWFTGRNIVEPYDMEKHRLGRVGAQAGEQAAQSVVAPYAAAAQGMNARQPLSLAGSLAKQGLGLRKPFQPYHGRTSGGGTLAQQAARRHARPRGPIEKLEKKAEEWLNE